MDEEEVESLDDEMVPLESQVRQVQDLVEEEPVGTAVVEVESQSHAPRPPSVAKVERAVRCQDTVFFLPVPQSCPLWGVRHVGTLPIMTVGLT